MPWTVIIVLAILAPLAGVHYYVRRKVLRVFHELTSWNKKALDRISLGFHLWTCCLPVVYAASFLLAGRRAIPVFAGDSILIDLLLGYPFWIALVVAVQLFLLFAFIDLLDISVFRLVPVFREWFHRWSPRIHAVIVVLITLYSLIEIAFDTWTVRVSEHEVVLSREFRSLRGLRIAQISDVQGDGRTSQTSLRRYVSRVNSLEPDIVLFAGDLVTSGTDYIDSTAAILGGLRSRLGTIAAIGDHDMFSDKSLVMAAFRRNGIRLIEDSTIVLQVDSARFKLTVVTYTYMQTPTNETLLRAAEGAKGAYKIFLVHQPAEGLIQFAQAQGYNLFLAGHTHGGGMAIGIPGIYLLAPANLETRYVTGLHMLGAMAISVTNGLGFTLSPIRFNAPAEITLLHLR